MERKPTFWEFIGTSSWGRGRESWGSNGSPGKGLIMIKVGVAGIGFFYRPDALAVAHATNSVSACTEGVKKYGNLVRYYNIGHDLMSRVVLF